MHPGIEEEARSTFGVALRPLQRAAVQGVLAGRDVRVLVPTGGGKSLCYQLPAVLGAREGRGPTLVVSPLVALIRDQVARLQARGIRAIALHAGIPPRERDRALREAADAALVYVSPERAVSQRFQRWLGSSRVAALAVDEAHCISEWGHDFRPEYAALGSLRAQIAGPVIACTATATPRVAREIDASLGLRDPLVVSGDCRRDNLAFSVEHVTGDRAREERIAEAVSAVRSGRAIVYAATRRRVRDLAQSLGRHGIRAGWYHAGRTDGARERAQQNFEAGKHAVLVATTAYGMGVDLPDVRLVVHAQAPGSFEAYYQQAGRAGRDGQSASCLLLFGPSDAIVQEKLRGAWPGAALGWEALLGYAWGSGCRQQAFERWFSPDPPGEPCGRCDACTTPAAVRAEIQRAQSEATARRSTRLARQEAARQITIDEPGLVAIVEFVDALRRPVGRTLAAAALRGGRSRRVLRWKLDQNPHFGELRGVPEEAVVKAIDALLADGRLARRGRKYPTVWIPDKPVRTARTTTRPPKPAAVRALESFRTAQAKRRRWKAYQVFPNATLAALVAARPTDLAGLAAIKGMGTKRIASFGTQILEILATTR